MVKSSFEKTYPCTGNSWRGTGIFPDCLGDVSFQRHFKIAFGKHCKPIWLNPIHIGDYRNSNLFRHFKLHQQVKSNVRHSWDCCIDTVLPVYTIKRVHCLFGGKHALNIDQLSCRSGIHLARSIELIKIGKWLLKWLSLLTWQFLIFIKKIKKVE